MVHFNAIGRDTFNASIILIVLDTIAVLLRLLTRRFSKISYAADDYWALVAVLFAYAELGISIWGKSLSLNNGCR